MTNDMFVPGKKYYLITYWCKFFEAIFIGTRPYAENINCMHLKDVTEYIFRTKNGDLFFRSDQTRPERDNNYITDNRDEIKLEIAKRVYRNRPIGRSPFHNKEKLLRWAMNNHPEKLL